MSDPPPASAHAKPAKAPASTRSLVALITALAGLATAVIAHTKQPEEPAARESYAVLRKAVEQLSSDVDTSRAQADSCNAKADALQAAFDDYVHVAAKQAAAPFVPAPTASAAARPARPPVSRLADAGAAPVAEADAGVPEDGLEPPARPSHVRKKAMHLPSYSDIESKARR
jgi:hypothetical protein